MVISTPAVVPASPGLVTPDIQERQSLQEDCLRLLLNLVVSWLCIQAPEHCLWKQGGKCSWIISWPNAYQSLEHTHEARDLLQPIGVAITRSLLGLGYRCSNAVVVC